jgi:CheY-like chemotaxis protein
MFIKDIWYNSPMSHTHKILVITKKSSFSDSLIVELSKFGYTVTQENSGEKGLSLIKQLMPELIVLDIELGDMDGYSILSKKSLDTDISKIPVFLVSANGIPVNMRSVPENSVTEFIMTLHSDTNSIITKVNNFFGVTFTQKANNDNSKKILWVEDDKLIGNILSKKLISAGFDLTHAKTGEEAINIISSNTKFDAILLDLMIPGMSGFDILQKVKNNPITKQIPVMILSNLSKPSDIERAKILGAQKFLVKAAASLDRIIDETKELCGK